MTIPKAPQVIVHHLEDVSGPAFLEVRHLKLQLEYQNGSMSDPFVHDVVTRKRACQDAVVIGAYDWPDHSVPPKIWLRSCVRPAVSCRDIFPNSNGSGWELPAGLIDQNESPEEAAVRELEEEVGFKVDYVIQLGHPCWGSVGIAAEKIHFYAVNVTGLKRHTPSEDGSAIEKNGECILVDLDDASEIQDQKTEILTIRLWRSWLRFNIKELGLG